MIDNLATAQQLDEIIASLQEKIDGLIRLRSSFVDDGAAWLSRRQIAAQLGVKPATVRRRIAEIIKRHPVETRIVGPRRETAYPREWVDAHLRAPKKG